MNKPPNPAAAAATLRGAVDLGALSAQREAQQRAYAMADSIAIDGAQMRRDIGYRAVKA